MTEALAQARKALANIAEGNLGDAPWQANYDRIRKVAADALAAIDAALEGGAVPKVKGLVWEEDSFGNLRAETPFGAEFIQKWTETGSGAVWFEHEGDSYESQEAAQAAAQAAYERRILSALDLPSPPTGA